jgi:murein endopeptidase
MLTLETLPNNGPEWLSMREAGIRVAGRMDLTGYSDRLLSVVESMGAANWRDRPTAG